MLHLMRRHAYSWITRAILILITVVFVFWGIGTGFFSQVHPIAKVDGQTILADDVNREAARLRRQLQQAYGAAANEIAKHFNLQQQALDQLIDNIVIQREARRLGLEINDVELQRAIESNRAFQVDGQFDFRAYQAVLRDNDMMPSDFEHLARDSMLAATLKGMIAQGVQVSDEEARAEFNRRNQNLDLAYVEIPYSGFVTKISPTEKEIEDFYNKNREAFREPERRKIIYIHYVSAAMAEKLQPTEKEIEDYYNRYKSSPQFTHPEQVRARHILIAVPSGATASEKATAKARAERILAELKKGANFAKLAAKYSDDPGNKFKGGDLGFFSPGQMVKPFEDAAFKLKPGETTLVETQFGYHILRVEAHKPAHVDTLEEARRRIIETLERNMSSEMAHAALHEDLAAALDGKSLKDLAQKRGLKAIETPFFAQNEPVKGEDMSPRFIQAAFKLDEGDIRAVTAPGTDPYLVKLLKRQPSRIPPLKEIEAKVREALVRERAEKAAHDFAESILRQVKSPTDFAKVAAANKLAIRDSGEFNRSTRSVPQIGQFPEVTDAAAQVAAVPGMIPRPVEHEGNSYVFEVVNRKPPTADQWKKDGPHFTEELVAARREDAWNRFVDSLKDHAKITIDTDQLGQATESSM
jgi:peptidyl-prolyl cis-trans isomerase D